MPQRSYTPTTWENEAPNGDPKYSITETGGAVIATAATIEMINDVTPGTPVNAANMNHVEQGVVNAQQTANEAIAAAAAAQESASSAVQKSLIATIGDLLVGAGAGSVERLPVGSSGQVLTVDGSNKPAWVTRNAITKRKGGSPTIWATAGDVSYDGGASKMQTGVQAYTVTTAAPTVGITVIFPEAFAYAPVVFATPLLTGDADTLKILFHMVSVAPNYVNFTFRTTDVSNIPVGRVFTIHWLAIGPTA